MEQEKHYREYSYKHKRKHILSVPQIMPWILGKILMSIYSFVFGVMLKLELH